jgi:1-deoxy-D-xylulose-5-phosphate reductoisomerase
MLLGRSVREWEQNVPAQVSRPRNVIVLGSTGTIGRLTLEIAARHPERLKVVGLAAGRNVEALAEQVTRFSPEVAAIADDGAAAGFSAAGWGGRLLHGSAALGELARWPAAEIIVNGIVGAAGLPVSLAALEAGRRLALANKESMVMAGPLLRAAASQGGAEILPVDSEHSAIFQCLAGRAAATVRRIVLTASGGPLRTRPAGELAQVTPAEALAHPTWRMGPRITIDSATLFNKGMELIEARWLFDIPIEQIEVWVHPQALVHGLVELVDGSLLAQLSCPDMRLPIQYALSYPERWEGAADPCDLDTLCSLTFEAPDETRFPCLGLAREAARRGGTAPAALNGADEVLVGAFLAHRITLPDIAAGLAHVLERHTVQADGLEAILGADEWARGVAEAFVNARGR